MKRSIFHWILAVGIPLFFYTKPNAVFGQETFYKGKTIRLIVGLAPGGGFDTYSRVIARHMGKHIPGNPTTVVENMPGAASLVAANYLYKVARPDGLTIGNFIGGLSFQQLLGLPQWYALFAPAGTAQAVIDRLNKSLREALADPDVIHRIEQDGAEVHTSTPEELGELVKSELAKWKGVVRAAKTTA